MVRIDMPMPDRCINCPCSYWIQTGQKKGMLMCNIMEYIGEKYCLVDEHGIKPIDCPMKTEGD